ncbi:26245_t:CDS:2 [Dentiscutata erythropus]|uniref:26245_t:CDS:1 n=1 Tax=Dentiscutata erythropus TaxID=1348616 RepID=A0A9N9I0G4_9GLOM|nr:26245_t:CDS:2 [Dentiscutata erythropus]
MPRSEKSIKDFKLLSDTRCRLLLLTFIALTLITIFSTINPDYNNDVLIEEKRPLAGYVIDLNRIDEHCEPDNYNKSILKKYPMQDCLDYLDKKQFDYLIKPDSPKYCNENDPMLFHVFWRGNVTDKLSLFIKSFLYTQPLKCSLLYVWLDDVNEDIQSNPYILQLLRFIGKNIEFKRWITEDQLNFNPLFNGWERLLKKSNRKKVVGFSDLVRFTLLHRYGGMYFDADALLLRDISPLYNLDIDFAYRWSVWKHYNTAILRLHSNSTVGRLIIEAAMKNKLNFHPMSIRTYLVNKSIESMTRDDLNEHLYMMPVLLFDPLWLKADLHHKKIQLNPNLYRWQDAYNPTLLGNEFPGSVYDNSTNPLELRKMNNFFRGAFTYHWHNQWKTIIQPTSWLGVMQTAYDAFLEGKDSNIYDEYLPL